MARDSNIFPFGIWNKNQLRIQAMKTLLTKGDYKKNPGAGMAGIFLFYQANITEQQKHNSVYQSDLLVKGSKFLLQTLVMLRYV